jgi:hypothetical protein
VESRGTHLDLIGTYRNICFRSWYGKGLFHRNRL